MGDDENRPQKAIPAAVNAMVVDTLGGRVQVSWDPESAATPFGQLVFFAEFLEVSGLFDAWVEECPLIYNSPNARRRASSLTILLIPRIWGLTPSLRNAVTCA